MEKALGQIHAFMRKEDGVTAIEYGLLAALIAVAIIGGATAVGGGLNQFFTGLGNWFGGVTVP
ncbi:Flp family type IVb pilin [Paraburkholderia sp. LEh10]|uniref:Flp family type IVb pilin n=1 Tax=Paraburkholderia sp. LEh10 TaxID=2821353 RepID=UPI001AEA21E1|nr:Flp family type IVb pilin [Paraburkholderia sp. LEh10]MBP0593730.1 Flp family type IVb pilin [Paraburkholderia sp. LEh10]